MKYFKYLGIKVDNVNFKDIRNIIKENINRKGYICTTCVHSVMWANKDSKFKDTLSEPNPNGITTEILGLSISNLPINSFFF